MNSKEGIPLLSQTCCKTQQTTIRPLYRRSMTAGTSLILEKPALIESVNELDGRRKKPQKAQEAHKFLVPFVLFVVPVFPSLRIRSQLHRPPLQFPTARRRTNFPEIGQTSPLLSVFILSNSS